VRGGPAVDWSDGVLRYSLFILRHELHVLRCEAEEALVWIDSYASIKGRVVDSAVSVPSRHIRGRTISPARGARSEKSEIAGGPW
jgi:hypothetical protein